MMGYRRKNRTNGYLVLGVAIIVLLAIGFFVQDFSLDTSTKYIEAPVWGYLSCSPTEPTNIPKMMSGSYNIPNSYGQLDMSDVKKATPYTCRDFLGIVDSCRITMTVTQGKTNWYDTTAQLSYQVVPAGTGFIDDSATTLAGGLGGYTNQERVTVELSSLDVLWVRYTEGMGLLNHNKYNDKVRFDALGTPYAIRNINSFSSTTGQLLEGSRIGSCLLEDNYYKNRRIQYSSEGLLTPSEKQSTDWMQLNRPNGVYTYFAGFTPVPSFGSKIETYQGKVAYCMNNAMYQVQEIRVNGFTYNVVNYEKSGFIGSVTCCNGDETPNMVCNNHQWVDKTNIECNLQQGIFCPQSTYQPYDSTSYKRFVCENNKCVEDVLQVKCTYPSNGCDTGEVCVVYSDPSRNQCVQQGVGGVPVCGDGKCDNLERDRNNMYYCPLDCRGANNTPFDATIFLIIGGFVVFILLLFVVRSRMNGRGSGGIGF